MLDFKIIELSDKEWIESLLKKSDFMGCEYSFANNFAWRRLYNSKIARYKDFYISRSCHKKTPVYSFPAGEGDLKEVILEMKENAHQSGHELIIAGVQKSSVEELNRLFPNEFTVNYDEADFDYIYDATQFIELKGKKYHGKRNHIKKFKENEWSFEPITAENSDECIKFATIFYLNNNKYDDYSAVVEQFAINTFFVHYKELGLKGGILRCNGKIAGFTIGEKLNSDTFVVHIEKALGEIQGAYPTLANEFARIEAADFTYINREEDLGIEGLRRAKKSFNPVFLLEKGVVTFN